MCVCVGGGERWLHGDVGGSAIIFYDCSINMGLGLCLLCISKQNKETTDHCLFLLNCMFLNNQVTTFDYVDFGDQSRHYKHSSLRWSWPP